MSETETNGQATEPTIEERVKTLEARLSDVEQRRREIERSAATVDDLAFKAETKKKAATAAKNAWEEAVESHMSLCRHWSKSEEVASRPLIAACEAKADPVSADESWRDEPIDVLQAFGVSDGLCETLDNQGFHVLGDLTNWTKDGHDFDDIRGVGITKAQQIADAFAAYWDARTTDVQDADDDEDEAEYPGTGNIDEIDIDDLDAAEDAEAAADETLEEAARWAEIEGSDVAELDYAEAVIAERSGLDLITSHPGSDPESNDVETVETKPKRRRKAKT